MRLRAILALAAAGVAALLFAPAAQAAGDYPPSICATLSVSTTAPLPGEQITVSGSDFNANASVRLELHSNTVVLKTVTTDSTGSFSTLVTLPSNVSGTHTIVAATGFNSAGGTCPPPEISLGFQGQSSSQGGGHHGGTSGTGQDILIMLIAAAVLISAGVAFNRSGKRRRHHGASV
jgi:hypothetical protein